MKLNNNSILILILVVGIALRFFDFSDIPFTHDEFSALRRTNFNSFSELIEHGVKVDGHPAGIQVFLYYWTKLLGSSEMVVKLPFMIFGVLSILLVYLIGRMWYNETVGLISASFVSSIQFAVIYSQIARPYISGLFFSLLMGYFWSKLVLHPHKNFKRNGFLFVLSAALCAYNHHFSLLFAVIIGISGLFLIKKEYLKLYIASGILVFLLYIPHINIFFHQLSLGGVEGWLGKPSNSFILNYLGYLFHFSGWVAFLLLLIVLFGFYKSNINNTYYKKLVLFSLWFILPFVIGFIYSKFFNSVLQFSVLIFSFPFIYFVLFGHFSNKKEVTNLILVLAILFVNTTTLVFSRDHYTLFYNSRFEKVLLDHHEAKANYENTLSIVNAHPLISDYYIKRDSIQRNFIDYSLFKSITEFNQFLEDSYGSYDYLFYGFTAEDEPLVVPVIQKYFPALIQQKNYVGGISYVFSKESQDDQNIIEIQSFEEKDSDRWHSLEVDRFVDTVSYSGNSSYLFTDQTEWGPAYSNSLWDIIHNENNYIDISIKIKSIDGIDDVILVASIESKDKTIHWRGIPVNSFFSKNYSDGQWLTAYQTIKLADVNLNYRKLNLKVYIWNKGLNNFLIDDFTIQLREGNPVLYGLFEKHY